MKKQHTAKYFECQVPHPPIVIYGMEFPMPASWCLWMVPGTETDDAEDFA